MNYDSANVLLDRTRKLWRKKVNPKVQAGLRVAWKREEGRLWRLALAFLILLATGLAALSWERLENLPFHLGAIPIGLLVLAILFAAYVYGRRREVSELKHLLTDLHGRTGATPSEEQLDQLGQVISVRSAASRS